MVLCDTLLPYVEDLYLYICIIWSIQTAAINIFKHRATLTCLFSLHLSPPLTVPPNQNQHGTLRLLHLVYWIGAGAGYEKRHTGLPHVLIRPRPVRNLRR